MTMSIEQKVLGLQISVDDVLCVQILESKRDLCCVEFGNRVRETLIMVNKDRSWFEICSPVTSAAD